MSRDCYQWLQPTGTKSQQDWLCGHCEDDHLEAAETRVGVVITSGDHMWKGPKQAHALRNQNESVFCTIHSPDGLSKHLRNT